MALLQPLLPLALTGGKIEALLQLTGRNLASIFLGVDLLQ